MAGAQTAGVPAQQGPQKAGVVTLARAQVPVTISLSGQASAYQAAAIRPLVDGVVTELPYQPGRPVKKGDPLIVIDPKSYDAALAASRASLQSAQAALPAAQAALDRAERLVGGSVTQETLESARVTYAQAQAAIAQAEAAVQTAQINLERTAINSPIDGIAAIASVSIGDLVTSGQSDALTTVTSLDPIYVDLSEASARMLQLRARVDSGAMQRGDRIAAQLTLENGQAFRGEGRLDSVGATVSTTTGTVTLRFEFANPERLILPGMFLRAELTIGTASAFLVPQLAATMQADGTLKIFVLDDKNVAQERRVTSIGTTDRAWIVSNGLDDGARLLVDNLENMKAGTQIAPLAATISEAGVVSTTPDAD
ncbi:MAG TPA: efflux RND transporter periplasmic adaptor subunit [Paenirhodobacter sp.]